MFDVIVIGAGVMGSSAAYYAAAGGASVLLLEQYRFLHRRGSSHGESRITRLTYPTDTYTSLTGRAHESWRALEREAGETLFSTTGGIDTLDRGSSTEQSFVLSCARNRVPLVELTAGDLAGFGLRPRDGTVSYWQPSSGVIHATSAVSALQRLAALRGAVLQDSCEVTQVVDGIDASGLRTAEVVTRDGRRWTGRRIIVAPGAWAGPVLRRLCGLQIEFEVLQTTVLYFRSNADFSAPSGARGDELLARQPVVIDYGSGSVWTSTLASASAQSDGRTPEVAHPCIYSCPSVELPGLVKFGIHGGAVSTAATRTFVPNTAVTVDPVIRWLRSHAPYVNPVPVLSETCLYTNTPDEDFIVDLHPTRPHIVVAAGFSGHGFKFGPLIGQAAAALALTGTAPFDVSAFRIARPCLGLRFVNGDGEEVAPRL